ncbi:Insulinase [anaerobic digester metagenome]
MPIFLTESILALCMILTALTSTSFAKNSLASGPKEAFWYDGKWAHEHSDLPPDPAITFGRLPNGFRYAVIPNAKPAGRVSMYLDIQAGSLMETPDELGYAHYIEHMAFNGTRNFAPGSLIPFFQRHGMSFGGDTNAHTAWAETVFKLNLTSCDSSTLAMGMKILRDFADGILFAPEEVAKELGVILAEKSVRDSEAMTSKRLRTALLYEGTAFVNQPIGTEDCIRGATSERLKAFYRKWYHPQRMILVIAGSVTADQVSQLVHSSFADMANPGPAPFPPSWGEARPGGILAQGEQRAISGEEVSVIMRFPRAHERDTRQNQQNQIVDSVLGYCMQRRLLERDQRDNLWNNARFVANWRQGLTPSAAIGLATHSGGWQQALPALAQELKRAATHGFTRQEIAQALDFAEKRISRFKEQRAGMSNADVADQFVRTANADYVQTSPAFDLDLFRQLRPSITEDAVNAALRSMLAMDDVFLAVGSATPPDAAAILAAWQEGLAAQPVPRVQTKSIAFPYLELPEAASVTASPTDAPIASRDLSQPGSPAVTLLQTRLSDAVECYVLPLSFEPNKASVQLLFGKGYANLPDNVIALAQTANDTLAESGLGALSRLETQRLSERMGGRVGEVHGPNNAIISVEGDSRQLELLVQAVWTQFSDPQPAAGDLQRALRKLEAQNRKQTETVEEVSKIAGQAFFYGNARRYQPLRPEEAASLGIDDVRSFITTSRKKEPVRVIISGDIDPNTAILLAKRYFSHITTQHVAVEEKPAPLVFPAGKSASILVPDSVDQAVIRKAWRLDFAPQGNRAVLAARQLAAALLRDKLRRDLRERMGASYSPSALYRTMPNEDGYSLLQIDVHTNRKQMGQVTEYLGTLAPWKVSQQELDRLRLPMLTQVQTSRSNTQYWQRMLLTELATGYPYLEWSKTTESNLQNCTKEAVTEALKDLLASPSAIWTVAAHSKPSADHGKSPRPSPGKANTAKESK